MPITNKTNKKMKKKVYAYLHTHWDREWYREFEEFRLRLIEVFDDVLKKLDALCCLDLLFIN